MSEETKTEATTEKTTVIDIKPSDVKKMLSEGKTRKEIGTHYGLNRTNTGLLFKDPRLKGLKTKNVGGTTFNLVDDGTAPVKSHAKVKQADGDTEKAENAAVTSEAKVTETKPEAKVAVEQENW